MAIRALNRLTARQVDTLGDGVHSDGGNLRLYVHSGGRGRSWVFTFTSPVTRRVREMGLGRAGQGGVSLAAAREERDRLRALLRDGVDPLAERARRRGEQAGKRSFLEVARLTLEKKVSGFRGGRDGSSYAQWTRTIDKDTKGLHGLAIDQISVDDVKRTISPMWDKSHHETARLTLGRLEAVFGFAIAYGWATNNPAAWSVFKHISPDQPDTKHHPTIVWADAPALVARLRQSTTMTAIMLEMILLTGVRLSEARLAEFKEVDFDRAVWTIPGGSDGRMKRGREHAVPLSGRALAIVSELRRLRPQGRYVFPAAHGGVLSKQAVWAMVCRATDDRASVHGLRSTFRSWAADRGMPFELAEAALSHTSSAVVQAYQRSQMIERRRPYMQLWADYLSGEDQTAEVIPFRAAE
jgi:integrase